MRIGILLGPTNERQPALDPCHTKAMQFLQRLGNEGLISLELLTKADPKLAHRLAHFSAIITRPNWGGELDEQDISIALANKQFRIATLSAGTDHIKISDDKIKKHVIYDSYGGNAGATAEFTIWAAITLRRRLHQKIVEMGFGYQFGRTYENLGSLEGCVWTLLGRGSVARSVLVRLPGLGIKKIVVQNHQMSREKFSDALQVFDNRIIEWRSENDAAPSVYVHVRHSSEPCIIEGTVDIDQALEEADIISLHLPDKAETKGIINQARLRRLKEGAVLLNPGRRDLIAIADEAHFIDAVRDKRLGGLSVDVLGKDIERSGKWHKSTFWMEQCWATIASAIFARWAENGRSLNFLELKGEALQSVSKDMRKDMEGVDINDPNLPPWPVQQGDLKDDMLMPNVIVTQHIAGAAFDAEESVANNVIGKLLEHLHSLNSSIPLLEYS